MTGSIELAASSAAAAGSTPAAAPAPDQSANVPGNAMPDKSAAGAASATPGELASPRARTSDAAVGTSELKTPDWVKDAVFYQVFPERFHNGDVGNDPRGTDPWGTTPKNDSMMGGDLNGLTQRLGYLKSLGVNALYMNPIFESPSNHKYNTTSYDRVDQHFGGDKAFEHLSDAAHKNGMKIMLDGVFNHVSHQHEWFRDVRDNGPSSEHFDKFEVHNWPIRYERDEDGILRSPDYKSWWGYATLPELDTDHPEVREYFLRGKDAVVKKWMKDGRVDGWRMDVADEVEPRFWREARKEIKAANPDAYLLAENWKDASSMVQGDQFDGAMNYQYFQFPVLDYFARKDISSDDFVERLQNDYPREAKFAAFNLLGSHDTPRYVTEAGGDWYRMRPAAIFQMTYVGAPVIYYGDELAMEGGKDPDNRRTMRWDLVPGNGRRDAGARATSELAADGVQGTPVGPVDAAEAGTELSEKERAGEVFSLYQKLIDTRTDEIALRRGEFTVLGTHNEDSTLSFRRHVPGTERDAIVALNNNVVGKDVEIPLGDIAADGTRFTDALSGRSFEVTDGRIVVDDLDGNFGAVLLRDVG